jgi:ABC-type proline/glycine betaine transport system substrate-binding protein/drug/metabolite transporter (DMT)-like permease
VSTNFNWALRHPVVLMTTAVVLWMLYPPIVNYLIDQTNIFYVAAVAHSFAAISTLLLASFIFFGKDKLNLGRSFLSSNVKKVVFPALITGFLSFSTHLLLYAALNTSEEFDVITILVYETWPILFFLIDSALRRDKRKITINDYIFSGAAFAGFIVLTAPNLDLADWILLDSPMLKTMGLALTGGLAMAVTCYLRMKCMDAWSEISAEKNLDLSTFKRGLLTEAGSRTISAILLVTALLLSNQEIPASDPTTLILLAFVGIVILALGSLLYDLSVFNADSASISALWYLMPVGAVIILAIMQGRLLNQYEAVASVLIVASNIFLVLRYPLRSSLMILFVSVCSIGIWILFAPVSPISNYYDLLAVSTIFFVLLATFALERATALNRERESLLGEFNKQVVSILERLSDDKSIDSSLYIEKIKHYVFLNLHSFVRAFKNTLQLTNMQKDVEKLKYSILPLLKGDKETREHLLGLFKVGDKLQTMESDRIPPEEFVILFFLGAANIFFSLVFRAETLSSSLFSLIVSTSMIYLLLIIFERDKYTKIRHDHGLICTNLMTYIQSKITRFESIDEISIIEQEIKYVIKEKSTIRETRVRSYWVFSVFAFLFTGFGYAFLFESLSTQRSIEKSPLTSTHNANKEEINIALLDWPGAQIKGHILAGIINQNTEFRASMVSISSSQAFKQMDEVNGIVDIHPDIWVENNQDLIRRYVKAFDTVSMGKQFVFGSQGLCYTEFESDNQSSQSFADISSQKMAKKYDLSGDGKGDIWVGSNDWISTQIEQRRLTSYGLNKYYNYHVFDPEVMQMLLERNNQKQLPSLFFCYYPDDVFMMGNVHIFDKSVHNEKSWDAIIHSKNGDLPKKGTSWPKTKIQIAYRSSLLDEQHELMTLLNSFSISNKELVELLAIVKNGELPKDVAKQWIELNQETILEWLTGFQMSSNNTRMD